jgi:integrase
VTPTPNARSATATTRWPPSTTSTCDSAWARPTSAADDLPKTAPKALDDNAQVRWLRAIEAWPHPRDRLLALLPFYTGLRIGDAVALDVADVRMSAFTATGRSSSTSKPRHTSPIPPPPSIFHQAVTTRQPLT